MMNIRRTLTLLVTGFLCYPILGHLAPGGVSTDTAGAGAERGRPSRLDGLPIAGILTGDPEAARQLLRRFAPRSMAILDGRSPAHGRSGQTADDVDAMLATIPGENDEIATLTRDLVAVSAAEVEALQSIVPFGSALWGSELQAPSTAALPGRPGAPGSMSHIPRHPS